MFDSQDYRVSRSQDLKKEKEGTFKNLGLVAAQCNGIAACAYSLKYLQYDTYVTVLYMICCIKTSFIFLLGKRAPNNPV